MSLNHHSEREDPRMVELLKKFQQQEQGIKQREWPAGRIGASDDGELVYKIGSDPETGIVRIDFGKPVAWLGLEPQHAIELAQSLIQHARRVAKEPIAIVLH